MKLRIWDLLNSSSEEATEKELGNVALYQEMLCQAAESWVRKRWGDNYYSEQTHVQVEVVEGESVVASNAFIVHAETTVKFRGVLMTEQD